MTKRKAAYGDTVKHHRAEAAVIIRRFRKRVTNAAADIKRGYCEDALLGIENANFDAGWAYSERSAMSETRTPRITGSARQLAVLSRAFEKKCMK